MGKPVETQCLDFAVAPTMLVPRLVAAAIARKQNLPAAQCVAGGWCQGHTRGGEASSVPKLPLGRSLPSTFHQGLRSSRNIANSSWIFNRDDHGRPFSAEAATKPIADRGDAGYEYEAPFKKPLKRVKILSVSSLSATLVSVPIMLSLESSAAQTGKVGMIAAVGFFGLFTTSLLHWFSSPYVCSLRRRKGTCQVEVETCTLVGTAKRHVFDLKDIQSPESLRPLITFEALGSPFYLDKNQIEDEEFLRHLPSDEGIEGEGETEEGRGE